MTIFGLRKESFTIRILERLEKWSTRFADLVLTANDAFRRLFVFRGCPEAKLEVVMNSPDEGIFTYLEAPTSAAARRDPARPYVIMYHGAIVARHGLDIAVQALADVKRVIPNAELHIYGRRTPFLDEVLAAAREGELQNSVRYHGPKNLEQIARAVDECDVGIVPNCRSVFTEINLPTRIFEYLSRGKPVIAPRTEGIGDYFSEEEITFFEAGNARDLSKSLQQVFVERELTEERVKRGQRVYLAHRWTEERARFETSVGELLSGNCQPKKVELKALAGPSATVAASGHDLRSEL